MSEPQEFGGLLETWQQRAADWEALNPEEKAKRTKARQEQEKVERLERLESEMISRLKQIPRRYRAASLEPRFEEWIAHFLTAPHDTDGLLFTGKTGTGKTYTLFAIMIALYRRGYMRIAYRDTPSLLEDLRPHEQADTFGNLQRLEHAGLLILDDLGAEKPTEWTTDKLYQIINARNQACRPMLVATNLPLKQLAERMGDRITSRLEQMCDVVAMTGPDQRRRA